MYIHYQKLDIKRALELKIIRQGWFKAQHILTDDQFQYGSLSCYGSVFSSKKLITTADGSWILNPIGFFAKETRIINYDTGEIIGTITRNKWDTTNTITLNNGLSATLARAGNIFSTRVSWSNDEWGSFIELKASYKFSRAFTIAISSDIANQAIPVALLSLVGANIVLTRQAQAAAIA